MDIRYHKLYGTKDFTLIYLFEQPFRYKREEVVLGCRYWVSLNIEKMAVKDKTREQEPLEAP